MENSSIASHGIAEVQHPQIPQRTRLSREPEPYLHVSADRISTDTAARSLLAGAAHLAGAKSAPEATAAATHKKSQWTQRVLPGIAGAALLTAIVTASMYYIKQWNAAHMS